MATLATPGGYKFFAQGRYVDQLVNGSPTKTQMVVSAGGRTQLSLLVTAGVVLMVLLFLTAPLAYMPEAVLSAVVILIGIDLIDLKGLRSILNERRSEFWVALITLSCTASTPGTLNCTNSNPEADGAPPVVASHDSRFCVAPDLDHNWGWDT